MRRKSLGDISLPMIFFILSIHVPGAKVQIQRDRKMYLVFFKEINAHNSRRQEINVTNLYKTNKAVSFYVCEQEDQRVWRHDFQPTFISLFKVLFILCFIHVSVLPVCRCVHHTYTTAEVRSRCWIPCV